MPEDALPAARCPLPEASGHGPRTTDNGQRLPGSGQRAASSVFLALLALLAPLASAHDSFLPITGRAIAADGRGFFTTLWITNASADPADVTIAFLASGKPNPSPRTFALRLAAHETRVIDSIADEILGAPRAQGALHITSRCDLVVEARVFGVAANDPPSRGIGTSWQAIPERDAVGNGETTMLQGVADGFRYKLYIVETTNHPLTVAIALLDRAGRVRAQKRLYLGAHEHRAWDLAVEFPQVRDGAVVRIRGVNGSGKFIAGGAQIAPDSQDVSAFAMSAPRERRNHIAPSELIAWSAVAIAIVAAALRGRA